MGRYMRKGKISSEVAVMEFSHQSPLGVRTRARALALQRLQKPQPEPPSSPPVCYLELRSRRLEKPATPLPCKERENMFKLEGRDRSIRETTPCSQVRDSESIRTPGSTTRVSNSSANDRRMQNSICGNFPTTQEMEEFFAAAEQLQLRSFAEKYNFDPANDCPLPGRYEWVKLDA